VTCKCSSVHATEINNEGRPATNEANTTAYIPSFCLAVIKDHVPLEFLCNINNQSSMKKN